MPFQPNRLDDGRRASVQTALSSIVTHTHQLLINRLDLMQVELRDVGQRAIKRCVDVALAMVLTFSGFVLLTSAAVLGLAQIVGEACALAICGGAYTALGLLFVFVAQKTRASQMTTSLIPDAAAAPRVAHDIN